MNVEASSSDSSSSSLLGNYTLLPGTMESFFPHGFLVEDVEVILFLKKLVKLSDQFVSTMVLSLTGV